jgi:predicted dehydrogenase
VSEKAFESDRKVRLGVWGLGRGLSFFKACAINNIEVVAGCDYNEHMRKKFQELAPDAFVTADADEFLAQDFDAVLLATFCTSHGPDAIRCLEAGKHVLSEVTAFHTPAEGVELVEAVERTGLVYNMAENYPYTAPQMYLAKRWREGLFGDLMYAEGEYVHEIRTLAYTYIDGVPVEPGWTLHNWRSWLNFHYYCTHSLGPIMHVTGTRPERVVTLPASKELAGYMPVKGGGMAVAAPSLIRMDNGGLVRNLMGAITNDTHIFRYWGDKGAAEIDHGLWLRLGGGGSTPKHMVNADWGELTPLARKTGHGGGDFFMLYYFARHILFGEPAFWDIYRSCDATLPGILAYRSAATNGNAQDVPDFRDKDVRDYYRYDHASSPRCDVKKGPWPEDAPREDLKDANAVIKDLVQSALAYRSYAEWSRVKDDMQDPSQLAAIADKAVDNAPRLKQSITRARELASAYPNSHGAKILRDIMDLVDGDAVLQPDFEQKLKEQRDALKKEFGKE